MKIKIKISGIYKIKNTINDKFYIGSSKDITKRWNNHKYLVKSTKKRKYGCSNHLYNAIRKDGVDNFVFEIVEKCNEEILIEREQYYIDTLKPDYNISQVAKGGSGKWPEERKAVYSERRKTEVAAGINVPPKGNAGNKDFRHTEESKQIIREKLLKAHERAERGSYWSEEGQAKRHEYFENLTPERRQRFAEETKKTRKLALKASQEATNAFAIKYAPIILEMQKKGANLRQIARQLNDDGHKTRHGVDWIDNTVRGILNRYKTIKQPSPVVRVKDMEILGTAKRPSLHSTSKNVRMIGWD